MTIQSITRMTTFALTAALIAAPHVSQAEVHSPDRDIVVLSPADLPQQARSGDAILLHSDDAGRMFLYLEQNGGSQMTVFDVTDPAHIKTATSTPLEARGAFDFVQHLNDRAELLRYRENGKLAVLDLTSARRPTIRTMRALPSAMPDAELGDQGLLAIETNAQLLNSAPRNFQVVDFSPTQEPALLTTIRQVQQRLTNDETGTTFLLGNEGLSVIRQPKVEAEHRAQEEMLEHN